MREFGKVELFRFKCPICGSLNKRYFPVSYKHYEYGYTLQCCNCGHLTEFVEPGKSVGGMYNGHFMAGEEREQRCFALNKCPHTDCPLYGTYKPDEDSGYHDEQGSGTSGSTGGNGTGSGNGSSTGGNSGTNGKGQYLGVYGDENLIGDQLEVKVTPVAPRYV